MSILAPAPPILEEPEVLDELEALLAPQEAVPCDCDHSLCGKNCQGHHLQIFTEAEVASGLIAAPSSAPCPRSASWILTLHSLPGSGDPLVPSPRYLCDECANYWGSLKWARIILEPLN